MFNKLLDELAISFLLLVLLSMEIDTGGTERKQAILVTTEVKDQFFGVECTTFRAICGFSHRNLEAYNLSII